jgi:hypothetical protein
MTWASGHLPEVFVVEGGDLQVIILFLGLDPDLALKKHF